MAKVISGGPSWDACLALWRYARNILGTIQIILPIDFDGLPPSSHSGIFSTILSWCELQSIMGRDMSGQISTLEMNLCEVAERLVYRISKKTNLGVLINWCRINRKVNLVQNVHDLYNVTRDGRFWSQTTICLFISRLRLEKQTQF